MHVRKGQCLQGFAVLSMLFWVLTVCTYAQDATIVGTIKDPSGVAVPNATVTATNVNTGLARSVNSDRGQYVIPNLAIGHYSIKVEAAGFKSTEKPDLVLNVDDRARIDFYLKAGSAGDFTDLSAIVKVQTDSGEISSLITGQQVTQLPTDGRSLLQLYNLTAGASSLQADFSAPTPATGDRNISFNGNRVAHNLNVLDGGENLDRGGASVSVMPSLDAIAEFRVNTSAYNPEYGLSSGAIINTTLKSGTKNFHGDAWEFIRNDAFNARDFTHPAGTSPAELRFNTFGFNLGGPIPIGKDTHPTFFFANVEWRRSIQGATLNTTVPLTQTYGGNFSTTGLTNLNFHTPCTNQFTGVQLTAVQNAYAAVGQTLSTASTASGNPCVADNSLATPGSNLAAWTGNTIPASLLSINGQKLLTAGIFPAQTIANLSNATGQFLGGPAPAVNLNEQVFRIDHKFGQKLSIFGHFIAEQATQGFATTQSSDDNVPTVGSTMDNPSYHFVVHATHFISSSRLNEVALNYDGNRIGITPTGTFTVPPGYSLNRLFPGTTNTLDRLPSIALSGNANYTSNWTPWKNKTGDYQLRDDFTWSKGGHQFKLGGSWASFKKTQEVFANTQGGYNFSGLYTGNSFADFLLGYSQNYSEAAIQDSRQYNDTSWAIYIQDNWRIKRRLTLNLGLRWDRIPHTYEANNTLSNFYPDLYNSALAAVFIGSTSQINTVATPSSAFTTSSNPLLSGLLFYTNGLKSGGNGTAKGLVQNDSKNFAPRLGFAYDLSGSGKTVIRGGFGTFYERVQGNDSYNNALNAPFGSNPTLNNVLLDNPHTQIVDGTNVTVPVLASGITGLANDYPAPISIQYNLGIQRALNSQTIVSLNYVGNRQHNQSEYREINIPDFTQLATILATPGINFDAQRPYRGFGGIRLAENAGNGHYDAFQAELRGQVVKGLNLQAGYTLSKAVDSSTGGGNDFDLDNVTNPYVGYKYDMGPSIFDRTHVAFVDFVYDVPFMQSSSSKAAKSILGGWQVSGIVSLSSGAPLNVTLNNNPLQNLVPNSGNRPDLIGKVTYTKQYQKIDPSCSANCQYGFQWFSPSSFAAPAVGTYGNLAHDFLRGPGRNNWNLSLFKTFNLTERVHFELRADSFNTWNHLQFKGDVQQGGISTGFGSSNFGFVTQAYDPRTLQLGGKILF